MLAIRLQRTGRSGHSQFRVIVQDSRFSPVRGRIVAYVGSYDPHTKEAKLDSEKIAQYLSNGAQPSNSAALLLKKESIKLPAWIKLDQPQKSEVRNPEKRRSTRPAEAAAPPPAAEAPAEEAVAETAAETGEAPAEETAPAETKAAPAEEPKAQEPAAQPEAPAEAAPAEPAETEPAETEADTQPDAK